MPLDTDICWLHCSNIGEVYYPFTGDFMVFACVKHQRFDYYEAWRNLRERLKQFNDT